MPPRVEVPKVPLAATVGEHGQGAWRRSLQEQQEEMARATEEIAQARARRQRQEDERAQQTLHILGAMEAHLAQLNSRIESVDRRIEAGNESSSAVGARTLWVAVLTLLATVAGIVVSWWLSR